MPPTQRWREIAKADASGAPFAQLSHLAYDPYSGDLYAVDHLRCTIFKINFLSGKAKALAGTGSIITTFVGSGQSGYTNGAGLKASFALPTVCHIPSHPFLSFLS